MSTQQVKDRFADYVPVSERLEQFYSDHPNGRVLTTIVEHDAENGFVLMRAEVYREPDDASPIATGHAFENRSEGFVNKTSYIENCETSATGRALALAGYEIKRGIASREEMEKTERMNGTGGQSEQTNACPECHETKAVIKGKAEYGGGFLCFKKKGGCGAKWDEETKAEPATNGFSEDQVLRDQLFAQAEHLLVNTPEAKRKDALGRLLMLSTAQMAEKLNEMAENVRAKSGTPSQETEREIQIREILRDSPENIVRDYLHEHFDGRLIVELTNSEIKKMHEDLTVPF